MKYAIMVLESPQDFANRTDPDNNEQYWASFGAYHQSLVEAGVMVGGNGLQGPDTATTVQLQSGKRVVRDGPFADTKEQLGGIFIIDVPDLDVALDWASRAPTAATGKVEIRPLMEDKGCDE